MPPPCSTPIPASVARSGTATRRRSAAVRSPVLSVEPGPWEPPEAASLGPGTIALVVLDGLFVRAPEVLFGPHEVIEPWGTSWWRAPPRGWP